MTEEFLHYIWKFRLFNNQQIVTGSQEAITVIHPGIHNQDSGPDFFNSKIKIGSTVWAGNVEIHINASDWKKHKHHQDKAYDSVILHVVYNNDELIYRTHGEVIPTLELKTLVDQQLYSKYLELRQSTAFIPCGKQINNADAFVVNSWLHRVLVERLEKKSQYVMEYLIRNKHDWEETFYQNLAKNFGFKVNAEPFEQLARSLPSTFLLKHKNSLFQIEALLFGQAGFLERTFKDAYPCELKKEFGFLKQKFNLSPLSEVNWKFMRLRPSNFPTLRISQFAHLIYRSSHLFSKIMEATNAESIIQLLNKVEASAYWKTHYTFERISPSSGKKLGSNAISNIIINTIVPFLFVYSKQKGDESFAERSFQLLEKTAAEDNSIIKNWKSLNISTPSAYQTQALLQLKTEYCSKYKCLNCSIGSHLLLN